MQAIVLFLTCILWCAGCAQRAAVDQNHDVLAYLETHLTWPSARFACAYEQIEKSSELLYLWAVCKSYDAVPEQGISVPVAITLDPTGVPQAHRVPRDGSFYGQDLTQIFPTHVLAQTLLSAEKQNVRIVKLQELCDDRIRERR